MSDWQPKIAVFLCQWALKSDSEWNRKDNLPPGVELFEVPCSGRINPLLLLTALQRGADGVLVVGCELSHCHYKEGNYLAQRKLTTLKSFLEHLGLEEQRLEIAWLSETDSAKFHHLVQSLLDKVQHLGPQSALTPLEPIVCLTEV